MFFFVNQNIFLLQLVGRYLFSLQIDRASAANLKRSKEEIEADKEEEDDFGYTTSEYFFIYWHEHDEAVEFFSAVRNKAEIFLKLRGQHFLDLIFAQNIVNMRPLIEIFVLSVLINLK